MSYYDSVYRDYELPSRASNVYVSPHETQNPDEFVTEVCYPIKKVK